MHSHIVCISCWQQRWQQRLRHFDAFRMSLRDLLDDDTTIARNASVMLSSAPGISFDFVISSEFVRLLATDGFVVTMDLLLRNCYVAVGVRYLYSMLPGVFNAVHEQIVCGSVWQQRLQQRMQQRLQKRLQQRLQQRSQQRVQQRLQ